MKNALATVCFLLLISPIARAENWPGWRGPRGDGTSLEKNVPVRWSETENVMWKVPVAGVGHSSPIVWQDRIYVTSCDQKNSERLLMCFHRDGGKMLWKKAVIEAPLEQKHRLNSFASSTPATDGERVYVAFLEKPYVRVVCYDMDGKEVWRKTPGKFVSRHGFCSSPILYKELLIVNCDQDARQAKDPKDKSFIVALDRRTGKEVWRIDERPHQIRSYCAPLIVKAAGKMQMVLSGTKCVTSYDPDTGKRYWIIHGPTEQYVASLVYGDGVFYLTAGFPTYHNMGIRPDGAGDVTKTHVLWHESKVSATKASYVPSPIAHGKHFYLASDKGYVHCFEAKTGKRLWMQELARHISASPVSANGLLYFLDDDGITWVLKAAPKFTFVAKNELDDRAFASPAVSRGQIFIRTLHNLYCIGNGRNGKDKTNAAGQ